jgi:hypothetical protein
MIAALFDIVNAASNVMLDVAPSCCSATQTQHRPGKNRPQIPHDTTHSSSTFAWLLLPVPIGAIVPSLYPAFTERRIHFAHSNGQGVYRQRLDLFST